MRQAEGPTIVPPDEGVTELVLELAIHILLQDGKKSLGPMHC